MVMFSQAAGVDDLLSSHSGRIGGAVLVLIYSHVRVCAVCVYVCAARRLHSQASPLPVVDAQMCHVINEDKNFVLADCHGSCSCCS
jgi:hypothetical protein